jgi:hypothetical protein
MQPRITNPGIWCHAGAPGDFGLIGLESAQCRHADLIKVGCDSAKPAMLAERNLRRRDPSGRGLGDESHDRTP